MELILEEIKFKDKSKDEQYMLLNTKLKNENKNDKKVKKEKVKAKAIKQRSKHSKEHTSKFNSKYEERIKSIKNTDKIKQENMKLYKKAEELIDKEEKDEKDKFLKETYDLKNK